MQRQLEFSRKVRLTHLDFALERVLIAGDVSSLELDVFLASDIHGKNRRKKAVNEIRKLFTSSVTKPLVSQAVASSDGKPLSEDDRLALYWSLFMVAFHFVGQSCAVVGHLEQLGRQFTSHAFARRLTDIYGGGRTTFISISEVLGMMLEWGVIAREKPGIYHVISRRSISRDAQRFLLTAMCLVQDPPVIRLQQFAGNPALFPFRLRLSTADLRHKGSPLRISVQGDREVLVEVLGVDR